NRYQPRIHRLAFCGSCRVLAVCQTTALGSIPLVAASHRCREGSQTTTHQKPACSSVLGILIIASYTTRLRLETVVYEGLYDQKDKLSKLEQPRESPRIRQNLRDTAAE